MHILVFGHSGQVASAFRAAAEVFTDFHIVTVGRDTCDITDSQQVVDAIQTHMPDLIVNAAAYTAVDKAEDERDAAFLVNEKAVKNIAEAASVPVVHLSTDYVFNGQNEMPYQVEASIEPLGVYGESKWAGEEILRQTCAKHIILRTAWVYSPFGGNFVKTMLRIMGANDQIRVVNDQRGCPTSATDIAKAILKITPKLVEDEFDGFGTYHLVPDGDISWHDFACEIQRQAEINCDVQAIPTSDYPTKAKRPAYSVLSMDKFKSVFGFGLPDWQSSLSRCLNELRKTGELS